MEKDTEDILKTVIETLMKKEASKFRGLIQKELASKINGKIEELKKALSGQMMTSQKSPTTVTEIGGPVPSGMSPSAPPAVSPVRAGDLRIVPTAAGANKDDVSLDPNFEKEFFYKSYEYKGQNVIVKQVGTGFGKPVRIYINDRRWEFFPGPKTAEKATKEYIDMMVKSAKKDPELASAMTNKVKSDKKAGLAAAPPQADAAKEESPKPKKK
jgi:hypothetical protein